MAKKPISKSKAVAPRAATNVVKGSWREQAAKSVANQETVVDRLPGGEGIKSISFKGGGLKLGDEELSNPVPIVILASRFDRVYYPGAYDPNTKESPTCYSYGDDIVHPEAEDKQCANCAECEHNVFGSGQGGRGKACKEGGTILAFHGDEAVDQTSVLGASIVRARFSVTNVKGLRNYIKAHGKEPTWAYITELGNEKHDTNQYKTSVKRASEMFSEEILDAIATRAAEAETILAEPFPKNADRPKQVKPSGKKRSRF